MTKRERALDALRLLMGKDFDPLVATVRMAQKLEAANEFKDAGDMYSRVIPYVYPKLASVEAQLDAGEGLPILLVDITGRVVNPNRDPTDDLIYGANGKPD